jgi:hypothetical protein
MSRRTRARRNRYGQRGVRIDDKHPKRRYIGGPPVALEDVYGDNVPEVFRPARKQASVITTECDRCGGEDNVQMFRDCPTCGPVPLCSACTELHDQEIVSEA